MSRYFHAPADAGGGGARPLPSARPRRGAVDGRAPRARGAAVHRAGSTARRCAATTRGARAAWRRGRASARFLGQKQRRRSPAGFGDSRLVREIAPDFFTYGIPHPPPRPSFRPSRSSPAPPLPIHQTAPPTTRGPTLLPVSSTSAGRANIRVLVFAAVAATALLFAVVTRWAKGFGDVPTLGNAPKQDSAAASQYGLTGPGIAVDRRAKLTLIVAWRTGCPAMTT